MDPMMPDEPALPKDPAGWIDEFRRQVAAIKTAADEFAFRWHAPEGRFVAALIGAMQTLTRLTVATQASLEATAQQAHATMLAELESVRELRRTVEAVKGQAQAVQMLSVAEREHAVQRMLERTLPLFAERLQKVLTIREARWNADQARKRYAVAGLVVLGVFLSGFGLAAWQRREELAIAERCLSTITPVAGHTYCQLDEAQPAARTP